MDLPTYTNIWRIEKRLYKLYDFRLPAPLPITWIGVFVGITVPYVVFLIAVGLPFNHTLLWLYVLPPGVLTWLTTRPVIESKRLPELVSSQLRYVAEPRTWCRMAPFAEKDEILVTARVWHRHPPKAGPKKAKRLTAKARSAATRPAGACAGAVRGSAGSGRRPGGHHGARAHAARICAAGGSAVRHGTVIRADRTTFTCARSGPRTGSGSSGPETHRAASGCRARMVAVAPPI